MNELQREAVVRLLTAEDCSCVIRHGDTIRLFRGRGVSDLLRLLHEEPDFLRGSFVADKVVGKGAAALMIAGGVAGLWAGIISRPALDLLAGSQMKVAFGEEVPAIINRAGTGLCPVEQACAGCTTAEECLPRIENFFRQVAERRQYSVE